MHVSRVPQVKQNESLWMSKASVSTTFGSMAKNRNLYMSEKEGIKECGFSDILNPYFRGCYKAKITHLLSFIRVGRTRAERHHY